MKKRTWRTNRLLYDEISVRSISGGGRCVDRDIRVECYRDNFLPNMNTEKCNGKNIYESEHEARKVREAAYKRSTKKLRIYWCGSCFGWHLTSTAAEVRAPRRSRARV